MEQQGRGWGGVCQTLGLIPPPPNPLSFGSYIPVKILTFDTLTAPYWNSNNHPWGGYGYFLEPHISLNDKFTGCEFEREM